MSFTRRPITSPRGFTLLELLIVISIIAILVVASFAVYTGVQKAKKRTLAALQVSQIVEAASQYYRELGMYPPDTGLYEPGDQPPMGMSGTQCEYVISRYLGREIFDKATGKTYGPYIRDMNDSNLKGDPTDVDGMTVQLYCDPWGMPYKMDCMHSIRDQKTRNVVQIKPYDAGVEPEKQTLEVKVWSNGPDKLASEKAPHYPETAQTDDEDNIMTWAKGKK